MESQKLESEEYRLVYRDAEGTLTKRVIVIKHLELGNSPSNSYIFAFCYLADDTRQFRFDRIVELYEGREKIKDPLQYLSEKYKDRIFEKDKTDTTQLAAEALDADYNKAANNKANKYKAHDYSSPPPQPFNIEKAKKSRKRFLIATIIFTILGLLSIPTVIWAIVYLLIALFLFLVYKSKNAAIKKTETNGDTAKTEAQ